MLSSICGFIASYSWAVSAFAPRFSENVSKKVSKGYLSSDGKILRMSIRFAAVGMQQAQFICRAHQGGQPLLFVPRRNAVLVQSAQYSA
jgi:hypothetical protein